MECRWRWYYGHELADGELYRMGGDMDLQEERERKKKEKGEKWKSGLFNPLRARSRNDGRLPLKSL